MKLKIVTVCMLFSGSVLASEQGLYLGVKGGVESITSKMVVDSVSFDSVGKDGSFVGGYLGYEFPISSAFSVSVEGEYTSHNLELKATTSSYEQTVRFENEYALSFLLSHNFNKNVKFYGRLGAVNASIAGKISTGYKGDDKVNGVMGGIGVDFVNDNNLTVRMEYRYIGFKKVDLYDDPSLVDLENEPKSHSFAVGAHYRF